MPHQSPKQDISFDVRRKPRYLRSPRRLWLSNTGYALPRLRFRTFSDWMLWAWLALMVRLALGRYVIKPETVVAWHRRGFRVFWTS